MQKLFLSSSLLALSLFFSGSLFGRISQYTLAHVLNYPKEYQLRIEGKSLLFTDRNGTPKKLKLKSVKRKSHRLYQQVKAVRRQQRLASQIAQQARLQQKNKRTKVSFSPVPPEVRTFEKQTELTMDHLNFADRHGILKLSIASDNRMSYRYEPICY